MNTNNSLPIPTTALRGSVQKTFVAAKILSGFTDTNHFQMLTEEYLNTLTDEEKLEIIKKAESTRIHVASLPALQAQQVVIREITNSTHIDSIKTDPLFSQNFGQRPYKFCYVDPTSLIALQAFVEPRSDKVPTLENDLFEFAFPRKWDVPAEVSIILPTGPIQVLSSDPGLQGLAIELDQATGKVMLSPPKHLNLVQVMHFQGKYFLRNGYHRVSDAIQTGLKEFPALVIEAFSPNEILLNGNTAFNVGYVLNLQRPPLVADFYSPAAIDIKLRERRYGIMVNLDIKPLNIGI